MPEETHYGVVTDNDDEEKRGRLKVKCQTLVGFEQELPKWIEPAGAIFATAKGGELYLPEKQSVVLLDVTVTDDLDQIPGERFLANPSIRWRYAPYTSKTGKQPLPEIFITNYPDRRGIVTPGGHSLIFDDKAGTIEIKSSHGHRLVLTDGEIQITPNGKTVMKSPTNMGIGATELMVLGNLFMDLFNQHTHTTGVGPSGAPIQQMTGAQLSQEGNAVK